MQVSSVNFWSMHNAPTALALSLYPCKGVHDSFLFKLRDLQLEDTQIARSSTRSQAPHSHCTPAIWLVSRLSLMCDKDTCGLLCSGPRTVFCSNWWTRSWPALVFRPLKIYLDDDVFQRRMLESYTQLPVSQLVSTEHTLCWNQKHFNCNFLNNLSIWEDILKS